MRAPARKAGIEGLSVIDAETSVPDSLHSTDIQGVIFNVHIQNAGDRLCVDDTGRAGTGL